MSAKVPTLIDLPVGLAVAPREQLTACLLAPQPMIPPRYFYDALGSRLFEAITELGEYYLTRTEAGILDLHGPSIFGGLRPGIPLVELGAGSCRKAERVLHWTRPSCFVALDVAAPFVAEGLARLQERFPALDLVGVGTDFSEQLLMPAMLGDGPKNLFYPGSSIGNFEPEAAARLLRSAARACTGGGALVVGVDLVKDRATLEAAYDDALGVTAAFNRNILLHVNGVLGSNFAPADWRHVAAYNSQAGRIEMYLEAQHALTVRWPDGRRAFAAGERIHTENSWKWQPAAFERLLRTAGFTQVDSWTDARGWFALVRAGVH